MGWSIGYDDKWKRDIGYGVPAICDHPKCNADIDRGLTHVCGAEPYGGEDGCGLYFCAEHLIYSDNGKLLCHRCITEDEPFKPKPDRSEWIKHKLTDPSWKKWRDENPQEVQRYIDMMPKTHKIDAGEELSKLIEANGRPELDGLMLDGLMKLAEEPLPAPDIDPDLDDFTEFGEFVEEELDKGFQSLCNEETIRKIIRETFKRGDRELAQELLSAVIDEYAKHYNS